MKNKGFIGIDNGKHGATAIIDLEGNIIDLFKYDEADKLLVYRKIAALQPEYDFFAFIEKPIVVYGLAHQTSPFETIGRHKMMLEILNIPYRTGDPAATSANNWKKIIGLYDEAKTASRTNSKEISELNKKAKKIAVEAELMGIDERELKAGKIAYMDEKLANLATEYRLAKKEVAKLKSNNKKNVKETSVLTCLKLFPDSESYIRKSGKTIKYDDDLAEALLLAECGRTLYINGEV